MGSPRNTAVLIGEDQSPRASDGHDWENRYVDHIWTYTLEDIWTGIQDCYAAMAADVKDKYGVTLTTVGSIGFSAMMHGYMAFNKEGDLLVPFRTWRNTITGPASEKLTQVFRYNVPQRWSIAHLYQAILNKEEHVKEIDYLITLEGYVHWKLTGRKVLGIGDVAGMFPVDIHTKDFDQKRIDQFDELVAGEHFP
ncbi:MAG: ATPase, partial [Clostridium sp.]|nr:ATPase [Clostridium sp.]